MTSESITYDIVRAVAAEKAVDAVSLSPLHEVVDPDALESLFDDADGAALRRGHVVFDYEGFAIRVSEDRSIELNALDDVAVS
jgi:hypothetical protein